MKEKGKWHTAAAHPRSAAVIRALLPVAVAAVTAVGVNLLGLSAECAAEVGQLVRWFA